MRRSSAWWSGCLGSTDQRPDTFSKIRHKAVSEPLFQRGEVHDPAYRNLRDLDDCRDYRTFCESLWRRYEPYADPHFLTEVKHQFNQRFWEMYLAVTFLERGYTLHRLSSGGPEFGIDVAGRRFWFDAITPTRGDGPDAVPQPELGARVARVVPQEQIILRITSALAEKREKWRRDLTKGLVRAEDGFIVAINGRTIRHCWDGAEMPYVVKALFGIGNLAVAIDRASLEVVETKYLQRPTIRKLSGTSVSSQPFGAGECPGVSAVLYSSADAARMSFTLGGDFLILHNPQAAVQLPPKSLRFAREYWTAGDQLHMRDYTDQASEFT